MVDGRDRKARLLCAARVEFASRGFDGAVIATMAEAAGVRRSTAFYHFHDKAALYDAAVVAVLRDIANHVCNASTAPAGFDAQLEAFVTSLVVRLGEEQALPRLLLREAAEPASKTAALADGKASGFSLLAARMSELLESGTHTGEIAAEDLTAPGAIVVWLCAELVSPPPTVVSGMLLGATPAQRAVDRCRQIRRLLGAHSRSTRGRTTHERSHELTGGE